METTIEGIEQLLRTGVRLELSIDPDGDFRAAILDKDRDLIEVYYETHLDQALSDAIESI